jgi:large subunit ribosomal protein L23
MSVFDIFKKKLKEKPVPQRTRKDFGKAKPAIKKPITKKPKPLAEKEPKLSVSKKDIVKKEKLEKKEIVKESVKEPVKVVKPRKIVKSEVAWKVLKRPHITEKATELTEENQYMFRVSSRSNKIEIKQAVEDVYGVIVEKVRIINVPPKKRRLGKTQGWRKGYKKAIVKIKKGQEIEVLPR